MTIHTTPTQRKEMAHAISELLGEPAVYMRTPTYAFQIGNVTVNRDGSTSCDDAATLERIKLMLIEKGYLMTDTTEEANTEADTEDAEAEPVQESTDEPVSDSEATEEEPILEPRSETEQMNITMLLEGITVEQLKNLVFMLYSKQNLLNNYPVDRLMHDVALALMAVQSQTTSIWSEFPTKAAQTTGTENPPPKEV